MRPFFIGLAALWCAVAATAADAWFIRFLAPGTPQGCERIFWRDNVLFYNQNNVPVSVRLLGMSNGPAAPDAPASITLPPGRVVSLNDTTASWTTGSDLWVVHADVPPGVLVESRDEALRVQTCIPTFLARASMATVSMPIVRSLAAPGSPQIYLGTDLGSLPSRMNVGVYNDALVAASATIVVRRTCDDAITDSRTVIVPPHSLIQYGGFQSGDDATTCAHSGWARYVTVTVDQPSFAYVANVTDAPTVGLAVAQTAAF